MESPRGETTKTKILAIQIQPSRSPILNCSEIVTRLRGLAANSSVSEGNDGGAYINIGLKAVNLDGLWGEVQRLLGENLDLARAAIVTCQGDSGWDDYLLLLPVASPFRSGSTTG